jgi:DNA primase
MRFASLSDWHLRMGSGRERCTRPGRACEKHLLMLDGDEAGRRASHAIALQLARHCRVRVIELPANVQPDQLSAETIREMLSQEGGKPHCC